MSRGVFCNSFQRRLVLRAQTPRAARPGALVRDESQVLLEGSCGRHALIPELVADLVHQASERDDSDAVDES